MSERSTVADEEVRRMGLFRDRTGSPRWSLFGSRPQPRRAKVMDTPQSPASPSEPLDEQVPPSEQQAAHAQPAVAPDVLDVRPLTPSERYPGLPALGAAEARARNGRGFAGILVRRRRKGHRHDHADHHRHLDVAVVESALDEVARALGPGLVEAVVWDARTGLALAGRGHDAEQTAPVWHRALRDVRAALPEAGLPAGAQHLVGLDGDQVAILLHVPSGPGACLTVRADGTLDHVLDVAVPAFRDAVASATRES